VFGNALGMRTDPTRAMVDWADTHGDVFRLKLMNQEVHVLAGADAYKLAAQTGYDVLSNHDTFIGLIRELGTDKNLAVLDGDDHKLFRSIARDGYTRTAMMASLPVVLDTIDGFVGALEVGDCVDVFPVFQRLISLELGEAVAGVRVDDHIAELQRFMRYLMNVHLVGLWPRATRHLPAFRRAIRTSHRVVADVVRFHQDNPPGPDRPRGLIDDFLDAHAANPDRVPMHAVKAAAFGPFLAGQDTVAATTAFLLYALFKAPHYLERVQADVDALFADGPPAPKAFKGARALMDATRETLRRYPVAPFVPKTGLVEFEFKGHRIPAGALIYLFQTLPQFKASNYPDPWAFDIDRPRAGPGTFAPFGSGPHLCIGAGMGEYQVAANVAALLHHGRFELAPPVYELKNRAIPLSPDGFQLRLVERRGRR
jgi:cytochrome P450